jgi:hypothetical protein
MLWLWRRLVFFLLVISSDLFLLLLLLRLLLLWLLFLLGRLIWQSLLDEGRLADNIGPDGLVADSLVPARHGWVLRAPLLVEDVLESTAEDGGGEQISKSETLADKVGVDREVILHDFSLRVRSLQAVVDVLLVVWVTADERTEVATNRWEELGIGEGHPAKDGGIVLLGLAEEGGLLVLGGDCHTTLAADPQRVGRMYRTV